MSAKRRACAANHSPGSGEERRADRMKRIFAAVLALCLCAAYASPLTGDTSNMGLWIAMVVVALIAVVVLLIVGRKKKK